MARRQPSSSLRRKVAVRRPRKTLVIYCEGARTEPEYLEALKREPSVRTSAAVDLRIEPHHGVPLTLVQLAVEAKRRAKDEEGEVDEFWCIFDVEWPRNHPNLATAVQLADAEGIKLAISNPCFELWLILHFRDHSAWMDNANARRVRRSCDNETDKGLSGATYMPLRHLAAERAINLEMRHLKNATLFPDNNPSSGMHALVASVEGK